MKSDFPLDVSIHGAQATVREIAHFHFLIQKVYKIVRNIFGKEYLEETVGFVRGKLLQD